MKLLGRLATVELDPEALSALAVEAGAFVAAGGVLLLDDWVTLTQDEKAALIVARKKLEGERACMLALALSGPDGYALVGSASDGGEAYLDAQLNHAVEKASATMETASTGVWR